MIRDWTVRCKDCGAPFRYSDDSARQAVRRGQSPPERCGACRRSHNRHTARMGAPYIDLDRGDQPPPPGGLKPGRLGRLQGSDRRHAPVDDPMPERDPDQFGIQDEHVLELLAAMHRARVVIVEAPTGSGKSTFLPWRLLNPPEPLARDHVTRHGTIIVTQPRIQATQGIPGFIATALHGSNADAGLDIGFRHSKSLDTSDARNRLVYATDGTLLNLIRRGELQTCSTVIIDEAHERSLNIDLILALMRRELIALPHLRLLIVSATIDAETFAALYRPDLEVATLQMPGKPDKPVHDRFRAGPELPIDEWPALMPAAAAETAFEVLRWMAGGDRPADIPEAVPCYDGDLLVFLPGKRAIHAAIDDLDKLIAAESTLAGKVEVLPLYAELPQARQRKALNPKYKAKQFRWRVIVSTNMAETSLTVEGVRHVVDSGLINSSDWDPTTLTTMVRPEPHSRSGLRQRRGRAGRVAPGIWHCLFTADQFDALERDTLPEIVRAPLEAVVLTASMAGVGDPASLRWLEPAPPADELRRARAQLRAIGAIDADGDPTSMGRELAVTRGSFDAASLLMCADHAGVAIEAATVLSAIQDNRFVDLLRWDRQWSADAKFRVDRVHDALLAPCVDDLEVVLCVMSAWDQLDPGEQTAWASTRFLDHDVLTAITAGRRKLLEPLQARTRTAEVRAIDAHLVDRLRHVIAWSNPNGVYRDHDGGWEPIVVPRSDRDVVRSLHDGATPTIDGQSHLARGGPRPHHLVALVRQRRRGWTTPLRPPETTVTLSFNVALTADHLADDVPLVVHAARATKAPLPALTEILPGERFTAQILSCPPALTELRLLGRQPAAAHPVDDIDAPADRDDDRDAPESGDLQQRVESQGLDRTFAEDLATDVNDLIPLEEIDVDRSAADGGGSGSNATSAIPQVDHVVLDGPPPRDEYPIVTISGCDPDGTIHARPESDDPLDALARVARVGDRCQVAILDIVTLHRDQRRVALGREARTGTPVVLAPTDLGLGVRDTQLVPDLIGTELQLDLSALDPDRGVILCSALPLIVRALLRLPDRRVVLDAVIVDAWDQHAFVELLPDEQHLRADDPPIVLRVASSRLPRRPDEMSIGCSVRVQVQTKRPWSPSSDIGRTALVVPTGPFELREQNLVLSDRPTPDDITSMFCAAEALEEPSQARRVRDAMAWLVQLRLAPDARIIDVTGLRALEVGGTTRARVVAADGRNVTFEGDAGQQFRVPRDQTAWPGKAVPAFVPGDEINLHVKAVDPAVGLVRVDSRDPATDPLNPYRGREGETERGTIGETTERTARIRLESGLETVVGGRALGLDDDADVRHALRTGSSVDVMILAIDERAHDVKVSVRALKGAKAKRQLVEQAEAIRDSDDWPEANRLIKEMWEEWKDLGSAGPLEPELRAEFQKSRDHFKARRAEAWAQVASTKRHLLVLAENLARSIDTPTATRGFRDLDRQWRDAGNAGPADDRELNDRYRAVKAPLLARVDAERDAATAQKRRMIAEAQSLAQSTDWRRTSDALKELDVRWRSTPSTGRLDNDLYREYRAAVDEFHRRRRAARA